jgi:hypothetical protein
MSVHEMFLAYQHEALMGVAMLVIVALISFLGAIIAVVAKH